MTKLRMDYSYYSQTFIRRRGRSPGRSRRTRDKINTDLTTTTSQRKSPRRNPKRSPSRGRKSPSHYYNDTKGELDDIKKHLA